LIFLCFISSQLVLVCPVRLATGKLRFLADLCHQSNELALPRGYEHVNVPRGFTEAHTRVCGPIVGLIDSSTHDNSMVTRRSAPRGEGDEAESPLARAVIGGLGFVANLSHIVLFRECSRSIPRPPKQYTTGEGNRSGLQPLRRLGKTRSPSRRF